MRCDLCHKLAVALVKICPGKRGLYACGACRLRVMNRKTA